MTDSKLFIASGIFHPEAGGPATYLRELLPQFQLRGWDVRVLTYGEGPLDGYPYPVTRVSRTALPVRLMRYARAARPLLRWADLTYIHTLGLPLIGDRRAPRVVKIVGDLAWERAIRKGWIPQTEDIDDFQTRRYGMFVNSDKSSRAAEACSMTAIIVPSEYLKRMVVGWGVDPAQIQVIYNALPAQTHTLEITQSDARMQLKLPDKPTVLTAARLTAWKGVDHLLNALARLPDIRLLIAGDGPLETALVEQTRRLGMESRVTFLGRVSHQQMPLYMRAADYLALYSGYEGLSHTLLESLRVGTPVIASAKGGNPEVVQQGVNGLLVPYVNVDALANALEEAFSTGMRAKLAANSEFGMERFTFARMVEHTDAALRAIQDAHGSG